MNEHQRPAFFHEMGRWSAAPLCAALLLGACSRPSGTVAERPNILLVSLDACRADHLGSYGYRRPTSPFLDRLASRGVRFSHAYVNTHGTTPSHTTILSSLYQETHRVGWDEGEEGLGAIPEDVVLLQEILQRAGYLTVSVTDGGNVGRKFGFDRGFELYDDRGGGVVGGTEKLLRFLGREGSRTRPVFAFYHTYEIHSPYDPPPRYAALFHSGASRFDTSSENLLRHAHNATRTLTPSQLSYIEAMYDGGIRFTDDVLRSLFERLERIGFLDEALVLVTADHGEELGDHGGLLHRGLLYEELVHVPLLVVGKGLEAGRVDRRLVSSVDLAPTVLGYVGLPIPKRMEGRDLFSHEERVGEEAVFSQYGRRRYAVRVPRYKLIQGTSPLSLELYDLVADPGETDDLARRSPELAQRLLRLLEAWKGARRHVGGDRPEVDLDAEELDHLRALGYVD